MKLTAIVCTAVVSAGLTIVSVPAHADGDHPLPPRNVLRAMAAGIDDTVPPPSSMRTAPGKLRKPPAVIKAVVVPLYWEADPPAGDSFTTQSLTDLMGRVGTWFHTVSRGRQTMTSTVLPWQKISFNPCGALSAAAKAAIAKVTASGRSMSSFNRLVVMDPQCNANTSLGQMPGRVTWIQFGPSLDVLVHELGHNLGLRHANSQICTLGSSDIRASWSSNCSRQEYGDEWDAMGMSQGFYSVPILKRLGWAGATTTTSGSGTFTLAPAENSGAGLQAVRLKISRRLSYWLEYRADASVTGFPVDQAFPGVQVRRSGAPKAYDILDGTPGNPIDFLLFPDPDMASPSLTVGKTLRTGEGIGITVESQDAQGAVVRITRPLAATAPGAPTLKSALASHATWADADQVVATWDPPASDGGLPILGYEVSAGTKTGYASAGETSATVMGVGAGVSVKVRALNAVGPSSWSNIKSAYRPIPSLTVTGPAEGASVDAYGLTFTGTAAPDPVTLSPLQWLSLNEDGSGLDASPATATWTLQPYPLPAGPHTFQIEVTDVDGAAATATRHLTLFHVDPQPTITSPTPGVVVTSDVLTVDFAFARLDRVESWSAEIDVDGEAHGWCDVNSGTCDLGMDIVANGTHALTVKVMDVYGDERVSPEVSFTLNRP